MSNSVNSVYRVEVQDGIHRVVLVQEFDSQSAAGEWATAHETLLGWLGFVDAYEGVVNGVRGLPDPSGDSIDAMLSEILQQAEERYRVQELAALFPEETKDLLANH